MQTLYFYWWWYVRMWLFGYWLCGYWLFGSGSLATGSVAHGTFVVDWIIDVLSIFDGAYIGIIDGFIIVVLMVLTTLFLTLAKFYVYVFGAIWSDVWLMFMHLMLFEAILFIYLMLFEAIFSLYLCIWCYFSCCRCMIFHDVMKGGRVEVLFYVAVVEDCDG